jgi:hypothetical protein
MGAQLVSRALLVLPRLDSHQARVLLVVMAHHAHDNDRRPSYFAGWARLANMLGYEAIEGPDSPGHQAVKRAVRELANAGLITGERDRPRSWKRRYWLSLPGPAPKAR